MNLDPRIIEGKKPLDCFDTEIAKQFIGKKGYFTNSLGRYSVLKNTWDGTLDEIQSDLEQCFYDCETEGYFQYFLPAEWVKESEKKYRPYSLNEFLNEHEIGDKITYRTVRFKKSVEEQEPFIRNKAMICGYQIMEGEANTPGKGFINLGGIWVSLQVMFDDYETPNSYLYPEVWEPFGVKENE